MLEATARIRYIPNFVDLDRYRATAKAFDLPRLELLFPRRLCAERGFRDLVDALDAIAPRHPALDLHLCGTGPARGRGDRNGAGSGAIPDACAGRSLAWTPCRRPTHRATSSSCRGVHGGHLAIVHRGDGDQQRDRDDARGGLPNLVIDGYNGILVAPGARALAEGIERLADDRALVERLARNALTVVPSFSRDRWRARWATLLTEHLPPLAAAGRNRQSMPIGPPSGHSVTRPTAKLRSRVQNRANRLRTTPARRSRSPSSSCPGGLGARRHQEQHGLGGARNGCIASALRGSRREAAAKPSRSG